MANSTITLYTREIGIEAEKLQMVEDFENYLSSKATSLAIIESYQYQKIELTKYLKVDISQSFQSPLKDQNYVYCKIVNSDNTRPIYYWIKKMNWKSSSCIELDLVLDTLNTFKMGVDYTFSPKTIIQRQHKDRMKFQDNYAPFTTQLVNYTGTGGKELFSNDKIYLYGFGDYNYFQTYEDFDLSNALFFEPIRNGKFITYLYNKTYQKIVYGSDNPTDIQYFELGKVITYSLFMSESQYYDGWEIAHYEGEPTNPSGNALVFLSTGNYAFIFENGESDGIYVAIRYKVNDEDKPAFPNTSYWNEVNEEFVDEIPDNSLADIISGYITPTQLFTRKIDFTEEEIFPTLYHNDSDEVNAVINDSKSLNRKWYLVYITDTDTPTAINCFLYPSSDVDIIYAGSSYTLKSIANLDRTLATIVKIIEVPYIPYEFTITNGKIDIPLTSIWQYVILTQQLKAPVGIEFSRNLLSQQFSPVLDLIFNKSFLGEIISSRNDKYESKMFHSEFYTLKYVYDSFALPFKFECLDMDSWFSAYSGSYPNIYDNISFKMSNTINSRFAFRFNEYITSDLAERDYNNYLVVARNNEPPIYNSAYLDYIRTGFNYDVKNKNANNAKNWIMVGASLAGTIASIIGAIVTEGATTPLAVMSVSGTIASVGTLTNAIVSTGQNERTINQKLTQLENQATNVSNADDLNLMNWYCDNKLHRATYKVNSRVDKLLKDLFYYYGYKDNISGIPNTNTRIWFNYLKCEPILEFTSINMTQEIEDELKGIMRNGFTIIHKYNNTWDIEQVKENWEVSMLPYLS